MNRSDTKPDYEAVTANQKTTWSSGDFHEIARQNVVMAEALCEAVDPHGGQRVLDVACGSGTAALVAARRYCEVTGIDYVPALLDRAQRRADAEGFSVEFKDADAQDLPFEDASFDVVLSVYGVQFAPDQQKAADEMLRVCRPGGTIALATPLSRGWSGDFFSTHARYAPPPSGLNSPLRWATEEGLDDLLGHGVQAIENEERVALQYYRSVDHAVDVFGTYFGPTIRASRASDEGAREQLREDLRTIFTRYNRAEDGTAVVENRYLLTIAARK